ncbi:MAG: hypothetical protein RBR33_01490 [Sulfurovaceae bacterium]|nr:hypothetical protein [Sulfurovaceae bacterium]
MKKTLLLSIVASTMIMAGGDIAPVEPAVVTPAPVVESNWKFSGQGVVYYQTDDSSLLIISGNGTDSDLFSQGSSSANAGLQLTATNSDLIAGIGFGAQLNALGTLGLEEDVVSNVMQLANGSLNSAYVSQLYLTYGIANTSLKVGRQELPKALSPFAYSEDWNVFTNTFNAALLVNTDLPDTVLVGAWVTDFNVNGMAAEMNSFKNPYTFGNGIFMLTAQNKSIADLTLTGSWYYGDELLNSNEDLNILWGDAQYNAGFANIGIQGGAIMTDLVADDTTAFGAMIGGKFDIVNAHVAYSHVNDSSLGMFQVGGSTSALYTETALDQVSPVGTALRNDMDKFVVAANADVLGGNLTGAYAYTDSGIVDSVNEVDVVYATHITENLVGVLAYVYADVDTLPDSVNLIRAVAKYNF